jgi:hypothetical protein
MKNNEASMAFFFLQWSGFRYKKPLSHDPPWTMRKYTFLLFVTLFYIYFFPSILIPFVCPSSHLSCLCTLGMEGNSAGFVCILENVPYSFLLSVTGTGYIIQSVFLIASLSAID